MDEKKIKLEFKKKAQRNPKKFYPVSILEEEGFKRRKCKKCGNYFWSIEDREICGDPNCSGGYGFIGDTPARKRMDFIQTWKEFAKLFKSFGYTPIPRYPVVARWREDAEFVQASIYDFQPYCVSGEVDPPANPLVVPQFCLRFNDIDNVGITGRHYTGFVMIGQHAFVERENYNPELYLEHIYRWLVDGMGIPREEIQFHEDAWAGGGNLGPSMEFFSRGLEIGNQVYMQYDITHGEIRELKIKVLDMGMGQERPAWFTYATPTSYEAVFPTVVHKLYKRTGIKPKKHILRDFLPYSGILNVEERENIDKTWEYIAKKLKIDVELLKNHVISLAALYSIADHTRALLVALSDGALPSNAGGGYNLRVLFRRTLDFIVKYNWDLDPMEMMEWHATYLKPQYPELVENLNEIGEVLDEEKRKYHKSKKKAKAIVSKFKEKNITLEDLIKLYDSHGISPEMLVEHGLDINIPPDFYSEVAKLHEKKETREKDVLKYGKFDVEGIKETEILYYKDYRLTRFSAKVLKIIDGKYVILDKTAFYPTSGGQLHDTGYINKTRVIDVIKQGKVIIHVTEGVKEFGEGDIVDCEVDFERRLQLAQHHTATHIINGVARKLLGNHVWQAGAEKTLNKARLDITHYKALTTKELEEIERMANEVVQANIKVESMILRRDEAERKYGFRLYQGGAVPGRELRVVKIGEIDVEACGGTHLNYTGEAYLIKIIGATKIQDAVVRIEFVAGKAALDYIKKQENLLQEAAKIMRVGVEQVPSSVRRFFEEWKELKKENERLRKEIAKLIKYKLENEFIKIKDFRFLCTSLHANMDELQRIVKEICSDNSIIVLFGINEKVWVVGARGEKVSVDMGKIVKEACQILGGDGGGRKNFARGAGNRKEKIKEAIEFVSRYIEGEL